MKWVFASISFHNRLPQKKEMKYNNGIPLIFITEKVSNGFEYSDNIHLMTVIEGV